MIKWVILRCLSHLHAATAALFSPLQELSVVLDVCSFACSRVGHQGAVWLVYWSRASERASLKVASQAYLSNTDNSFDWPRVRAFRSISDTATYRCLIGQRRAQFRRAQKLSLMKIKKKSPNAETMVKKHSLFQGYIFQCVNTRDSHLACLVIHQIIYLN